MKKSKKELLRDYIFADSEYDREDIIKEMKELQEENKKKKVIKKKIIKTEEPLE
jgi:hypothetical protein